MPSWLVFRFAGPRCLLEEYSVSCCHFWRRLETSSHLLCIGWMVWYCFMLVVCYCHALLLQLLCRETTELSVSLQLLISQDWCLLLGPGMETEQVLYVWKALSHTKSSSTPWSSFMSARRWGTSSSISLNAHGTYWCGKEKLWHFGNSDLTEHTWWCGQDTVIAFCFESCQLGVAQLPVCLVSTVYWTDHCWFWV